MLVENTTVDDSTKPTSGPTSYEEISSKLNNAAYDIVNGQGRLLAELEAKKKKGDGLIARRTIRVGRNDPCPNHKDVKFKNCECYKKLKTRILVPLNVARQMQGAKKR